jgi:Uma2 family endonuclease
MSSALKLAVADYDAMIQRGDFSALSQRIELFRGELVETNPAGPVHDDFITFLSQWSIDSTRDLDISVRTQCGLTLSEFDSRPEPDVLWVKRRRYLDRHPNGQDVLLVIEVADSSKRYDRVEKALLYAEADIQEFWVVDVEENAVVVHRKPSCAGFTEFASHGFETVISPLAAPNAKLSVRDLFAK